MSLKRFSAGKYYCCHIYLPTKAEREGQAKKCLPEKVGIAHLFSSKICLVQNIMDRKCCRSEAWETAYGGHHHPLCRDAGESRSWEPPPVDIVSAPGGRKEGIPDVTPSPQSCSLRSEGQGTAHAPRVLIWPLFLRQELQRPLLCSGRNRLMAQADSAGFASVSVF